MAGGMLCRGERKRTEVGGEPDGWAPRGSERRRDVGWAEVASGPSGLGCGLGWKGKEGRERCFFSLTKAKVPFEIKTFQI